MSASRLERLVVTWTAITTVFTWTVTNRGLWRPSISSASIGAEAHGRTTSFWVAASLAMAALALFTLYGRRRGRLAFAVTFALWHGVLIAAATMLAIVGGVFVGGTWGWVASFRILGPIMILLSALALWWLRHDRTQTHPDRSWTPPDTRRVVIALLLTPVVAGIFQLGAGYDSSAKAATALAVAQWLLLLQAVEGRPASAPIDEPRSPNTETR